MRILKDRTALDVKPSSVHAAVVACPGDLEVAVKQVLDWDATGKARSKKAGTLLLAALRSQARPRSRDELAVEQSGRHRERVEWCRVNVPDEHPPFAAVAADTLEAIGVEVTPDSVRARLEVTGRDMASLEVA